MSIPAVGTWATYRGLKTVDTDDATRRLISFLVFLVLAAAGVVATIAFGCWATGDCP